MSHTTDELFAVGQRLLKDGYEHSGGIVLRAVTRMKAMERLIVDANENLIKARKDLDEGKKIFDEIVAVCKTNDTTQKNRGG